MVCVRLILGGNLAVVAAPLTKLASGSLKYHWDLAYQDAFHQPKTVMTQGVVQHGPDSKKRFSVQTDANCITSDAVLF